MAKDNKLGIWMAVALVVGNIIGSGIFLLPSSLAPFGFNSVWAWLLTSTGAIMLALVFAGLSRALPKAEGPYGYTRAAFGDLTAFIVIWGYWISNWVGNAAIATAAVSYLSNLLPWIANVHGASAVVTVFFVWLLTAVNIHGVRAAGNVQLVSSILKLIPFLGIAGLGLYLAATGSPQLHNSNLTATPFRLSDVTAAATLTLWALMGLESAAVLSEKVRDPERNVARATLIGTFLTAIICVIACTAVMLVIPGDRLAHSNAPFAEAASLFWGSAAAHWLALFAAISALGALNGWTLLNGELTFQLAKNRIIPSLFARESSRLTPTYALCLTSGLSTIMVLMNYGKGMVEVFTFMILLSTTAILIMYLMCSLAALKLVARGQLEISTGSKGLVVASVPGAAYALWALAGAGRDAVLWGFALLAVAVPVYFLMRRTKAPTTLP
jgi:APA family basic amino acid/polyamine antiporter